MSLLCEILYPPDCETGNVRPTVLSGLSGVWVGKDQRVN